MSVHALERAWPIIGPNNFDRRIYITSSVLAASAAIFYTLEVSGVLDYISAMDGSKGGIVEEGDSPEEAEIPREVSEEQKAQWAREFDEAHDGKKPGELVEEIKEIDKYDLPEAREKGDTEKIAKLEFEREYLLNKLPEHTQEILQDK